MTSEKITLSAKSFIFLFSTLILAISIITSLYFLVSKFFSSFFTGDLMNMEPVKNFLFNKERYYHYEMN